MGPVPPLTPRHLAHMKAGQIALLPIRRLG
jgi:hypothetical protein